MIRAPLSTTSVLDEAADVVRMTLSPWAAFLVATSIPYRFLQALFLDQLLEVGSEASHYGHLLGGTANMIVAAVVLALFGRAVYARACRLAIASGGTRDDERQAGGPRRTTATHTVWRVPPAAFASYVLTASAMMLAGWMTMFTIIGYVVAVMFAGLAVGTMELNDRVSLTRPFVLVFRYARSIRVPLALVFVFFCALFVALVNVSAAFGFCVWLASAFGGFEAPHWQLLFSAGNRRYILMLIAGAILCVEPFWVAAHVVFVRKAGAEESGDDLRAWFDELRRAS